MGKHGKHRALVSRAAIRTGLGAAVAALAIGGPAAAAECRLALVLALDVSSSVDAAEDRLQRQGLAAALIAPEVQEAFFVSDLPVALAVFEWSGRYNQAVVLDWTVIRSGAHLHFAAERIAASRRSHDDFPTAMGHALGFAAGLLGDAPDCLSRTIDMAGDGINNEGFPPSSAYSAFDFAGVTVNGLVVNAADFEGEIGLIDFFRQEVLRGPGAFIEIATGFEDYEVAMRRKLVREVSSLAVGALRR